MSNITMKPLSVEEELDKILNWHNNCKLEIITTLKGVDTKYSDDYVNNIIDAIITNHKAKAITKLLYLIKHQTKLARIDEKNHAYNLVGALETPQMVRDELKEEIRQLQGEIDV